MNSTCRRALFLVQSFAYRHRFDLEGSLAAVLDRPAPTELASAQEARVLFVDAIAQVDADAALLRRKRWKPIAVFERTEDGDALRRFQAAYDAEDYDALDDLARVGDIARVVRYRPAATRHWLVESLLHGSRREFRWLLGHKFRLLDHDRDMLLSGPSKLAVVLATVDYRETFVRFLEMLCMIDFAPGDWMLLPLGVAQGMLTDDAVIGDLEELAAFNPPFGVHSPRVVAPPPHKRRQQSANGTQPQERSRSPIDDNEVSGPVDDAPPDADDAAPTVGSDRASFRDDSETASPRTLRARDPAMHDYEADDGFVVAAGDGSTTEESVSDDLSEFLAENVDDDDDDDDDDTTHVVRRGVSNDVKKDTPKIVAVHAKRARRQTIESDDDDDDNATIANRQEFDDVGVAYRRTARKRHRPARFTFDQL